VTIVRLYYKILVCRAVRTHPWVLTRKRSTVKTATAFCLL